MRRYHGAVWNEPIIYELGHRGERGHVVPEVEEKIKSTIGDAKTRIAVKMRRKAPPKLPEISEPEVMTHYLHLSQQTFGVDSGISIGVGTCTMKYNPKVNEQLARSSKMADIHPLQDEETAQGILEIMYKASGWLQEITGMDEVSLQPSGGSHAVFTNCCIMRAYHKSNDELEQRRETVVPLLSHPCNAAAPAAAGFKVITLEPDSDTGCPDIEALKAVVSKNTAGMLLTDPYDTGVFDPNIEEYANILHEVGGLVLLDQANANSILGIVRAGDMGADMCHLNLHKSFAAPHGSTGPGSAAIGVKGRFRRFLPVPVVEFDGSKYHLNYDRPDSIGKTRGFLGNIPCVLRAYAWMMALGAEGIKEAAEVAVLNNNYIIKRLSDVPGLSLPYAKGRYRMQEARFSWEKLKQDTGIGTEDLNNRIVDFGVQTYFPSHHPWIIPEPMTLEPTESVSKADLDRFCEVIRHLSHEAYTDPDIIRTAPHNCAIPKIDLEPVMSDIRKCATTWRAYLRKREKQD
jgi:glycine dehydrogenase subunit 2